MDKDICEYFDSFGLSMPTEDEEYLTKSEKTLFYSPDKTDKIQEEQVFYAATSVCIIYSRGRMAKVFLKFYTIQSFTQIIKWLIMSL